eukprot:g3941.t1
MSDKIDDLTVEDFVDCEAEEEEEEDDDDDSCICSVKPHDDVLVGTLYGHRQAPQAACFVPKEEGTCTLLTGGKGASRKRGGEDSADLGKSIWGVEKTEETGVFVPFDKQLPNKAGVRYYTASGYQECQLCLNLLEESEKYGVQYHDLCSAIPVPKDMVPMCEAQKRTLQSCPEFTNQWCYQDLGGTQQLRAPCPGHLVCHYCLGLNPLHCVTMDANYDED